MSMSNRSPGSPPEFQGTIGRTMAESEPWWPSGPTAPEGAPNVVVMIVDDMGYSDIASFGSEIPTPHLDEIAGEGVRLSNFHTTPVCSPTRASLMTGCNPHAVGFGFTSNIDPGFPGYAGELPANQPTIAEILRDNGYSTLMVGKWHMCKDSDMSPSGNRHSWPLQRGFEQFYGFLEAQTNLHHPHRLFEGNQAVFVDDYPEGYYLTDDLTERAIRMIHEVKSADPAKPFLLYYAHGAVHTPLHAKAEDIERFRDRYAAGWDTIREQRFARQREMGLVPPEALLAPLSEEDGPQAPAWAELTADEQRLAARYMEVYAAMVASIDESMGRIRQTLDQLGVLDNTIFVFLSDNGAADGGHRFGIFNHLGNLSPTPKPTPEERLQMDLGRIDEIGGPTSWPAYGHGWATTANTPFRRHKFTTYRGGHQVPCLISWRRGLLAGGQIRHQYTNVSDLLPTLLELTGLQHPGQRQGRVSRPLDGVSQAAVLTDANLASPHVEQYYECMGQRAYYRDSWEVVAQRKSLTPFRDDRWALFDVETDPTQCRDVAEERPSLVTELVTAWEAAAEQNQVFPLAEGTPIVWFQAPESDERYAGEVTLFPQVPSLERFRSSKLIDGRSFAITVDWDYREGDNGVLVAHGGQEGGYVLYALDGKLHFLQNAYGRPLAIEPVPLGEASREVVVSVTAPGKGRWLVSVDVDGRRVVEDADFVQLSWLVPWNGIDVGLDRRSPVSWELRQNHGTFPFSGRLNSVTYTPGELAPDSMKLQMEQFREMGLALQ